MGKPSGHGYWLNANSGKAEGGYLRSQWRKKEVPKDGSGIQGSEALPDRVLDEFGEALEIQLLHDLAAVSFHGF